MKTTIEVYEQAIEELNRQLIVYRQAINKIDDYFEYTCESDVDRKRVHSILDTLTERLREEN